MAAEPWKKKVVTRAMIELEKDCANAAGAGAGAVLMLNCHLASITSTVKNDEVTRLADSVLASAEALFLGPSGEGESDLRRTLFAARAELSRYLSSLDLVEQPQ
jgi:hypothetical protein